MIITPSENSFQIFFFFFLLCHVMHYKYIKIINIFIINETLLPNIQKS